MGELFEPIKRAIAFVLSGYGRLLGEVFGERSGATWTLAIVLLTVTVRLLLFPLFVKQIKSQREMQVLQPKVKALQAKHKGDRETLNREVMALYKEHKVNPLAGCLPLILQMPILFGVFSVLRTYQPKADLVAGKAVFEGGHGVSAEVATQLGSAKLFGAPISAQFNSKAGVLDALAANATTVKVVALLLIAAMTFAQVLSTKQLMARAKDQRGKDVVLDPQQQMQQRMMLIVMPVMLALFGFTVPIGLLVYWTATNTWSLGQQAYVMKRLPVEQGGTGDVHEAPSAAATAAPLAKPSRWSRFRPAPAVGAPATPARSAKKSGDSSGGTAAKAKPTTTGERPAGAGSGSTSGKPGSSRPANRSKSKRKPNSRRGGRR